MLVTEYTSDGRTIVRLRKDWHPDRISKAYIPPMKNHVLSRDAYRIQTALLNWRPTKG